MGYYDDYKPKDEQRFSLMLNAFRGAIDLKNLDEISMWYVLDPEYAREDISVAHGRVRRELALAGKR